MELDDKTIKRSMIATGVALVILIGGFVYHTHNVNAKEAAEKQALLVNIDKQHEQEYAAQKAKANAPVVDESHPARYQDTTSSNAASTDSNKATTSAKATTIQKIPTQTPPTTTTPPAQSAPKVAQSTVPAITSLSDVDIQRLQSYPVDSNGELYVSFNDMYTNQKSDCDTLLTKFSPLSLSTYNNAKVGWLTNPKLVYYSSLAQYCVRGILSLTYYGDNALGLTPNATYQCDVEYKLRNSVTNGSVTLKLESTNYLSSFKVVK